MPSKAIQFSQLAFNNKNEVYKIHFCPKKLHKENTAVEVTPAGCEEVENSHPVGVGVPANFREQFHQKLLMLAWLRFSALWKFPVTSLMIFIQ